MSGMGRSGIPASAFHALSPETLLERLTLSGLAKALQHRFRRTVELVLDWARVIARWAAPRLCQAYAVEAIGQNTRPWRRWTNSLTNSCIALGWKKTLNETDRDLAQLVRESAVARAVLTQRPLENADAAELLQLQRSDLLRPMVRQWLRVHVESLGPVADRIYAQLALKGPSTIGSEETEYCLAVIPEVAGIFSQSQATAIVTVVARLAATPTDPYSRATGLAAARAALAELLALRPEVDEVAIPEGSGESMPSVRACLKALAVALHRDTAQRPGRFLSACERAGLGQGAILELATAASTTRPRGQGSDTWAPMPAIRRWLRHAASTTLAWVIPAVAAVGLALTLRVHPVHLLKPVPLDVTLATFALIATVHALIITLSREHLPRRMARIAATPHVLVSAYFTSMIGIAASVIDLTGQSGLTEKQSASWGGVLNGLAAASVLVAVTLLAASSFKVLRLSDPVAATTAFGRASALTLGRSGSRFGRFQARSLELTTLFKAIPNVLISPEVVPGEAAQLLRAGSRGLFVPANRPLRRLFTTHQFKEGMSLRVVAPLGKIVARLDPVLALVPTATQLVSSQTLRRATAVAALNGIGWLDRSRGVTASLYDLAVRTSREGDQGGAQRAASVCLDLCFRHLSNMSTARGQAYARARARVARRGGNSAWRPGHATWQPVEPARSGESPPASPVITDLVESCIRSLSTEDGAERDVAMYVLRGLLAYGNREDRLPTLVTQALVDTSPERVDRDSLRLKLFKRCALRSLELDLTEQFIFAFETMLIVPFGEPIQILDQATATLAAAARINAEATEQRLKGYLADKRHDDDTRSRALFHIGAAALDAGALRLAVVCADNLRRLTPVKPFEDDLDLEARLIGPGSHLGNIPRATLAQFSEFSAGLDALVST